MPLAGLELELALEEDAVRGEPGHEAAAADRALVLHLGVVRDGERGGRGHIEANEAKVEEANKEVTEGAGSDVLTDGSVTLSASSQPVQPADPDEPKFEVPVLPGPNDELET